MNSLYRNIITALAAVMAVAAVADVKDLPVTNINGKLFHYYKVDGKESIYSVVHKLKVPKDSLLRYNPSAEEGLKSGMTLYFPFDDGMEAPAAPTDSSDRSAPSALPDPSDSSDSSDLSQSSQSSVPSLSPLPDNTHLVQRGETIYGLA
ncbi:MAG: hypothetical protein K2H98_02660, partial [Duncaniella sp.]|nr:hypothetical protein [Duncaniella sp.]